jgi:Mg2+/Co2+ transporter CorC/osmotically-inducible protein OsmY
LPPRDIASVAAMVSAAIRTGAVPLQVGESLEATLKLSELRLRDVMVPRVDVRAVPDDCPLREAMREMAESGHTRLPVFRGTLDHPLGILHVLDLVRAVRDSRTDGLEPQTAGALARPGLSLPETLPILEAMQAMRSQAVHLALVTDEHAGLAGLATLNDVLEQVVGPAPDVYASDDRSAIRSVREGLAIVGATARLREVEEVLDVRFPRSPSTSMGGLMYERLQRVPKPGDVIDLPGMRIEVLSVDGARIRELRVRFGVGLAESAELLEVGIGKEVVCNQDVVAHVERLVGDARTGRVSGLVIRAGKRTAVVPLAAVGRTDEGVVYLTPGDCDLDRHAASVPSEASLGIQVTCTDGPAGRLRRVVLDRTTGGITHMVVATASGLLPPRPRDIVVPLSWARSVTSRQIELGASRDELFELPEFHSDDEIRVEVLERINADPRFQGIDRYTQKIDVYAGLVRLSGHVRTQELKMAAHELAAATRGVLSVDNQLIADDELVVSTEQAVLAAGLPLDRLEVSALLGQVTLRGQVVRPEDREAAERIARRVPGVESVVNHLRLKQHSFAPPTRF